MDTFLKDTKHTLQLIEETNDKIESVEFSLDGVGLVSLDVEKMYNNITEELGMGVCKKYLDSRIIQGGTNCANRDPEVSSESLLTGLDLCLKNNCFKFNNKVYKQKGGVGTGIKLAPPYACLAMGEFELEVFNDKTQTILDAILLWKRFIDDILILFKGSREECDQLVDWLNIIMPGVIKLKYNYSTSSLDFLDLKIMIQDGKLVTQRGHTQPS